MKPLMVTYGNTCIDLSTLQFEGWNALGYIPIDPTTVVEPAEVRGGGISEILVTNADSNQGYYEKSGLIEQVYGSNFWI